MRDHTLHSVTAGWLAIGIAALARMHQTIYAMLDDCDMIWIAIVVSAVGFGWGTKVEAQFFHAMGMTYVNEKTK